MRLLAVALVPLLSGCLSFTWRRATSFTPPRPDSIAALEEGRSTLAECLDRLGAPLYVWEYKADGAALAWGSAQSDEKFWSVSLPLYRQLSASFRWDDREASLKGVVLLFDRDGKLELVRTGFLRDLREQLDRRRPAAEPAAG